MEMQIALVGPSYESRTIPLSAQVTRNLYPEPVPNGLTPTALLNWPGAKLFSDGESLGPSRGLHEWRNALYAVIGEKLYRVSNTGVKTEIGDIPGQGRCVIDADASFLYIVTEGLVYRSNGSTVEAVTDEDLESPNSVAIINNQALYDGLQGRFVSASPGDGSVIESLNYATAEALSDELLRVYPFNQQAYMMGSRSIEPWYNSGVGTPPFDRIDGAIAQVGIAGVYCVTNTDKAVYFLGHDRSIYRLEGPIPRQVSSLAVSHAIENYDDVSDCFAFDIKLEGQTFVIFTFPSANQTWAFSESFNVWFELSSGIHDARHIANDYAYAYNKHIISDYRNGNLYEWDLGTFSDNGATIIRERTTQPIYSDFIDRPGKTVFWNSIELVVNSGYGLPSGQGSTPQIMMQYSDDLGHSWSDEVVGSAGEMGAYNWRVRWFNLGASVARIYRFRVSDPVEMHFFKLFGDVEVGV